MSMPVQKQVFDLSKAKINIKSSFSKSINPEIKSILGCSIDTFPGGGIKHSPYGQTFTMGTSKDMFTGYSNAQLGVVFDLIISDVEGTAKLILATSTGIFTKTDAAEANPKTWAGAVSEATIIEFKDKVIIFPYSDNANDVAIYSDASVVGIGRPADSLISFGPSEATGATEDDEPDGALIDDLVRGPVKYFISYITSAGAEGALSPASTVYDAKEGDSVRVIVNTTGLDTSTQLQLYRTYAGRHQPYAIPQGRLPITDSATDDNFLDQVPDHRLGELPLWHGDPPPKYVVDAIPFAGRILALAEDNQASPDGTTSELFISDPDNEGSWWTTADGNRISVGNDSGDIGTALIPWGKNILVAQKNHMYTFSGRSSDTFRIDPFKVTDPRNASLGIESKVSYVKFNDGIYLHNKDNVYRLTTSGSLTDISEPIKYYMRLTHPWETKIPISLGSGNGLLYVSLPDSKLIFGYSFKTRSWIGIWHGGSIYPLRYFNVAIRDEVKYSDPICAYGANGLQGTLTSGILLLVPTYTTVDFMGEVSGVDPDPVWDTGGAFQIGPFFGDNLANNKNFLYVDVIHTFNGDTTILRERININSYGEFIMMSFANIGNTSAKTLSVGINGSSSDFIGTLAGTGMRGRVLALVLAHQEFDSDSQ